MRSVKQYEGAKRKSRCQSPHSAKECEFLCSVPLLYDFFSHLYSTRSCLCFGSYLHAFGIKYSKQLQIVLLLLCLLCPWFFFASVLCSFALVHGVKSQSKEPKQAAEWRAKS
uniref:Uncharacterized protein n=1 Tax=Lacunastrum gracillimum TaxID=427913 RepID=A0A2U8GH87_9CHLO|nr:hypothetical protein [Lacunastrum gracillimum]AWI68067.1 hypothetical protein [Lacunastrum gracillimum]